MPCWPRELFVPLPSNGISDSSHIEKRQQSLRGGEADAAILWHCDGSHKDDEIASLRSQ